MSLALLNLTVCFPTLIVRSDLVRKVGPLDPNLRFGEDGDFLFRVGLLTDLCVVNMPLVLVDLIPAGGDI